MISQFINKQTTNFVQIIKLDLLVLLAKSYSAKYITEREWKASWMGGD